MLTDPNLLARELEELSANEAEDLADYVQDLQLSLRAAAADLTQDNA